METERKVHFLSTGENVFQGFNPCLTPSAIRVLHELIGMLPSDLKVVYSGTAWRHGEVFNYYLSHPEVNWSPLFGSEILCRFGARSVEISRGIEIKTAQYYMPRDVIKVAVRELLTRETKLLIICDLVILNHVINPHGPIMNREPILVRLDYHNLDLGGIRVFSPPSFAGKDIALQPQQRWPAPDKGNRLLEL